MRYIDFVTTNQNMTRHPVGKRAVAFLLHGNTFKKHLLFQLFDPARSPRTVAMDLTFSFADNVRNRCPRPFAELAVDLQITAIRAFDVEG